MPRKPDEYLRQMNPMNMLFALSSIGLLLTMGWMVYDDYARAWKGYQKGFARLDAEKTRREIEEAAGRVDQEALASLQEKIDTALSGEEQHAGDLEAAEALLVETEAKRYKDDLDFRTAKSTYDARKFDYEEVAHHHPEQAEGLAAEMQELEQRLTELRISLLEHEKTREATEKTIQAITGLREGAQNQLTEMLSERERLTQRLDTVAPRGLMRVAIDALNAPMMDFIAPTLKIQQVVLDDIPIDINFVKIPRADRCQTCHLGSAMAGFEDDAQPYATHPRLDLFVGDSSPHPVNRFGCTPCHAGRDRAVDFVYATHMPDGPEQAEAWEATYDWERDHHWDQPMLARSRIEAGCMKCHQGVVEVAEAPRLNRGLALIERYGCFGCHKMEGFNDRPKIGPPLSRITSKTTTDWVARWIKNPTAFRPSTRMPRLFGLANNQRPGDSEREDAEVLGIVAYLEDHAERFDTPPLPGRGSRARGEKLVKTVGCMGCHAIDRDEIAGDVLLASNRGQVDDPVAFERRFGPDLSRVGSKLRPEWIYRWVRQPHDYNPATRMPSLRLTTQEALDITAYLGSLEDDSPAGERVSTVRPQSEARDRTLMAYLTQRMIPDDARAKLDSMSERDRDVMLGERSIQRYGCFGCHLIPGFETTPPIGVDLSQEGSKHQDRLFFGFVQVEHTAPAWFFQKLKHPRSFDEGKVAEFYDRLRMPHFGFTDEQADAITLVLQGLTKEKVPLESVRRLSPREDAVEKGRRIIRDYNCQGCHTYEGSGGAIRASLEQNFIAEGRSEQEARSLAASFGPPILDGEGDKVQTDWLFSFLKNPQAIRPWLAVRMPTFGFDDAQADTLVHHFAASDERTFPFQTFADRTAPRGADLQAALSMFTPDYFNCWNCHQQGDRNPQGPPEGWAPDLMMARERLNPDWIERWIENPQALMPGTKMPTYYIPDDLEASAPPDILGGDPHRQIRVLADYVFNLGSRRDATGGGR